MFWKMQRKFIYQNQCSECRKIIRSSDDIIIVDGNIYCRQCGERKKEFAQYLFMKVETDGDICGNAGYDSDGRFECHSNTHK